MKNCTSFSYIYKRWIGEVCYTLKRDLVHEIIDDAEFSTLSDVVSYCAVVREDNGLVPAALLMFDFGILNVVPEQFQNPPPGFQTGVIVGGEYACMPYAGSIPHWRWMHDLWLDRQRNYILDASRPYLAIGKVKNDLHSGKLLLPVKPSGY